MSDLDRQKALWFPTPHSCDMLDRTSYNGWHHLVYFCVRDCYADGGCIVSKGVICMDAIPSPITVRYSDDQRILMCHETRLLTHAELDQLLRAISSLIRPGNVTAVLLDARAQRKPFSLSAAYNYGMAFVRLPTLSLKFAIVVVATMECRAFLELVARNRGVQLRYFTDVEQAQSWLLN